MIFGSALASTLLIAANFLLPQTFLSLVDSFWTANDRPKLNITVRDSFDGRRVAAGLTARTSTGTLQRSASLNGEAIVTATGRVDLEIAADGYLPINTYFVLNEFDKNITVWLDSADQKLRLSADSADPAAAEDGTTVFEGFVYDRTGLPVAGAELQLDTDVIVARTLADGSFRFSIATPEFDRESELPRTAMLTVRHSGIEVYKRTNMFVTGGKTRLILDLSDEPVERDGRHKFQLEREELEAGFEQRPGAEPFFAEAPAAVPVPQSIRVGSNCATATTCTVVNVYSIDTYTRNGLDNEWIASWNANSLKAGAIAYRTYGSYHVYHPRVPASYDICNTTSCQVNDPATTHVNTNNATTQTTGSIVTNAAGTDALFSEYSAENNLAPGCPDGSTGRPEHNWPCLADPVDVGTTYFGHGRGMCQWGSQRWSINQGKDFVWIVNHYYNANGNPSGLRTGVFQMGPDTLLPPPELTEPGNQTAPGSVVSTFTPTFTWAPVTGATGYSLYVSRFNGSTYDIVYNSETALGQPITATSFTLPAGILVANGQYRWNMSSYIPAGYGTPNTFRNYFTVSPTVSLSGKVTNPSGIVIRNATVTITDNQGIRRNATTSSFGIYSFTGVAIGQQHTVAVATKRYRFTPQVLTVNGNLSNVDFVGLE
jgi:hypothetical protein